MNQLYPKYVLIRSKSQVSRKLLNIPTVKQPENNHIHYKSSTKIITNVFHESKNDLPKIYIIKEAPQIQNRNRTKSGMHVQEFKIMTKTDKMQLGLSPRSNKKKSAKSATDLNEKLSDKETTLISFSKELLIDRKPDTIRAILARKTLYSANYQS